MGFGGILAAMAGGLGDGMKEVAKQGWRSKELQKEYDFRRSESEIDRKFKAEQAELDRKHDFDLLNTKSRIGKSASQLSSVHDKFTSGMQALSVYDAETAKLDEKIANTTDKDERNKLINELDIVIKKRNSVHASLGGYAKSGGAASTALWETAKSERLPSTDIKKEAEKPRPKVERPSGAQKVISAKNHRANDLPMYQSW